MVNQPETTRYQAIRAQIAYLRSPERKDGPSRYEAEEAISFLEREAEALCEQLFLDSVEKINNNLN